jgi:predicted nucleic acid-binding protein
MNVCFDTNILIDASNGLEAARAELRRATVRVISIVTEIEFLVGCRTDAEEAAARQFLTQFQVVPVSSAIANATVNVRRTTRLRLPDAIVLATAQVSGCQLTTRNTKDFQESDPMIRVPYRI